MKKIVLIGFLCLISNLYSPCYAQDCPEVVEGEEDDYNDMYPFCDNIDTPLDDGVPFLIMAGVVFGLVYKRSNQNRPTLD